MLKEDFPNCFYKMERKNKGTKWLTSLHTTQSQKLSPHFLNSQDYYFDERKLLFVLVGHFFVHIKWLGIFWTNLIHVNMYILYVPPLSIYLFIYQFWNVWGNSQGYRYLSYVPPAGWVWHKAFLGGSGCRSVAHTGPAPPKMSRAPSKFPPKQAPGEKPSPYKECESRGDSPLRPWGYRPTWFLASRIHVRRPRQHGNGTRTHPNRSLYWQTRPTEVCPRPATLKDCASAHVC